MNDNDILIARKAEDGCKTIVIDGDVADFERQNRRVKERQLAEDARRKEMLENAKRANAEKAAKEAAERAERAKRRKQMYMTFGLVLSVAALMAMTRVGLMHTIVGMAFIAGDAAVFGYHIGGAR